MTTTPTPTTATRLTVSSPDHLLAAARVSAAIACHYERRGDWAQAARRWEAAGDDAKEGGDSRRAAEHYAAAARCALDAAAARHPATVDPSMFTE
ncbi:MAG: hypothetical protein ACYDEN_11360 [Acidimicrobiales bacterium]